MKHKVGDKVRVKSKDWFDAQEKNKIGAVKPENSSFSFVISMVEYCGKELSIDIVKNNFYLLNGNSWNWADWMLEDDYVIKKHAIQRRKFAPIGKVIY